MRPACPSASSYGRTGAALPAPRGRPVAVSLATCPSTTTPKRTTRASVRRRTRTIGSGAIRPRCARHPIAPIEGAAPRPAPPPIATPGGDRRRARPWGAVVAAGTAGAVLAGVGVAVLGVGRAGRRAAGHRAGRPRLDRVAPSAARRPGRRRRRGPRSAPPRTVVPVDGRGRATDGLGRRRPRRRHRHHQRRPRGGRRRARSSACPTAATPRADVIGVDPTTGLAVLDLAGGGYTPSVARHGRRPGRGRARSAPSRGGEPRASPPPTGRSATPERFVGPSGTALDGVEIDGRRREPSALGGPVTDDRGAVLGITTAVDDGDAWYVVAGRRWPTGSADDLLDRRRRPATAGWASRAPSAGGRTSPADPSGTLVASVVPDSPAALGGIRPGDVVVALDDDDVADMADLHRARCARTRPATGSRSRSCARDESSGHAADPPRRTPPATVSRLTPARPRRRSAGGATHEPAHERATAPTTTPTRPTPATPRAISWRRRGLSVAHGPASCASTQASSFDDGGRPALAPAGGRRRPPTGAACTARSSGGVGPRPQRNPQRRTRLAIRSGSGTLGGTPISDRTSSPGIDPSGATLYAPSSRRRRASSTAAATSSRSTNCTGGSSAVSGTVGPGAGPGPASRARRVAGGDAGRPQDRGGGPRVGVAPLGGQPLDLGPLGREGDAGVGAQRGVLGERHRVVGPRAVDGGARQHDDVGDARRRRRRRARGGPRPRRRSARSARRAPTWPGGATASACSRWGLTSSRGEVDAADLDPGRAGRRPARRPGRRPRRRAPGRRRRATRRPRGVSTPVITTFAMPLTLPPGGPPNRNRRAPHHGPSATAAPRAAVAGRPRR